MQNTQSNIGVGSTVSGDSVNIHAGHDVTVKGSTVAGTNDVSLAAAHDLTITTSENINSSHELHEKKTTGFGTAGIGISYGTVDTKDTINDAAKTSQGSLLAANNQVNLLHSTDTDSTRSTNESKSGSIGVSYGSSGWGVEASGSKAKGDGNADSTAQGNTHIKGANSVSIVSGGDTDIKGATVDGGQVSALIGGDLNIASVQDTSHSAAHQESQSAGVSISQGGGSASFSNQHGSASGDYAGVEEQSGIHAGAGGFDINVKGDTDLHGAYISSDADAAKNTLTTGTLSFSDITNQSNYSASSNGFSAGGSMGAPNSAKANGVTAVSDGGGVSPMIPQHDSGSETATTKSAISVGSITVTDTANQKQDIASLNRDTTDLNGTVSKLPDLSNLLSQQASTQQAAAIVAQTVATQIGNYADRQAQAAKDAGDADTAAKWAEGGEYRIAMHIAGGAAVAALGGGTIGSAVEGAAGAGVSAAAAGKLNEVSNSIAALSPTGNPDEDKALGQIISNVIATGAGAVVGGTTGAATASSADLYNRQLHAQEKSKAQQIADQAKAQGLTNADGSPITAAQVENAMRAANNSHYGESVFAVACRRSTPVSVTTCSPARRFTSRPRWIRRA
jgi:filamentous hemagglutinin